MSEPGLILEGRRRSSLESSNSGVSSVSDRPPVKLEPTIKEEREEGKPIKTSRAATKQPGSPAAGRFRKSAVQLLQEHYAEGHIKEEASTDEETEQRTSRRSAAVRNLNFDKEESRDGRKKFVKAEPVPEQPKAKEECDDTCSESSFESHPELVDGLVEEMPHLTPAQTRRPEKGYNPAQTEQLMKVFQLTWHPTIPQKQIMSEKLNIAMENLRYWFDNNRRKFLRVQAREQARSGKKSTGSHNASMGRGRREIVKPVKYSEPVKTPTKRIHNNRATIANEDSAESEDDSSASSSEEEEEEEQTEEFYPELALAAKLESEGQAVCVAYETSELLSQCTFCNYSCPVRGNMYKHVGAHGFTDIRFCKEARDQSHLLEGARGCRVVYTAQTFDMHWCRAEAPAQLGDFVIKRGVQNRMVPVAVKKEAKKKKKKKKEKKARYSVPDGSPAKFYCDTGYARLFHRLASRDKHAFPMDTTFHRNGQLELVYLTAYQMRAVREFCQGSDKYFLVGLFCLNKICMMCIDTLMGILSH